MHLFDTLYCQHSVSRRLHALFHSVHIHIIFCYMSSAELYVFLMWMWSINSIRGTDLPKFNPKSSPHVSLYCTSMFHLLKIIMAMVDEEHMTLKAHLCYF